jgi:hypothetical protein
METISIPSPSVFLKKSPLLKPLDEVPQKKAVKPRKTASTKPSSKPAVAPNATQDGAIAKPKQSKSRNGMEHKH